MIRSILSKSSTTTNILYKQVFNLSTKRNYSNIAISNFTFRNSNSNISQFLKIEKQSSFKFYSTTPTTQTHTTPITSSSQSSTTEVTQQQQPIVNTTTNEIIDNKTKYNITITEDCAGELRKVQSKLIGKDVYLRVMVDMGGCSGYQYIIKVDDKMQEDDVLFIKDEAKVIIDKISLEMMEGSVIDYETNLMRSSFCVASNPNTIKSCGCKISFDLKK